MMTDLRDVLWLLRRPAWTRGSRTEAIRQGKVVVDNAEPAVVFLVGIRINQWRRVRRWLPLLLAMPRMLRELVDDPGSGLAGYRLHFGPGLRQAMVVQYWRSPEELHRFARRAAGTHRSAQSRYWWHYGAGAAVGVWHEFLVSPQGAHHGMYGNMPPFGIGALRPVHDEQWWATAETPTPERSPANCGR